MARPVAEEVSAEHQDQQRGDPLEPPYGVGPTSSERLLDHLVGPQQHRLRDRDRLLNDKDGSDSARAPRDPPARTYTVARNLRISAAL